MKQRIKDLIKHIDKELTEIKQLDRSFKEVFYTSGMCNAIVALQKLVEDDEKLECVMEINADE